MEANEISAKIDELVSDLKKSLLNSPYNSRNFFDKVKNWWQNVTKGADNQSNPYYFQNKFGSLGSVAKEPLKKINTETEIPTKEVDPNDGFKLGVSKNESKLTLKDYLFLTENINLLNERISSTNLSEDSSNIKNLEMFRIIDNWATNFKKQIIELLGLKNQSQNQSQVTQLPKMTNPIDNIKDFINFNDWIKTEENMEFFISLVNRIFDSPLHSSKISVISKNLKNKKINASGKTPLNIAVRNKILSILRNEIIQNRKENSVFSKSVWAKYEDRASKSKSNDEQDNGVKDAPLSAAAGAGENLKADDFSGWPGI